MAQLLDNVLDSLQQKLETQLDSAVGIDLKADCGTESDEDEPGDVKALREFGFDSWKLDGCGAQTDMQLWDDVIKATPATSGRDAIMVGRPSTDASVARHAEWVAR